LAADLASLIARLEAAEGTFSEDEAVRFAEDAAAAGLCRNMDPVTLAEALEGDMNAALSLVPEGMEWQVSNRAPKHHAGRAYIHNREMISIGIGGTMRNPRYRGYECTAATPELATVAAALKARAQG